MRKPRHHWALLLLGLCWALPVAGAASQTEETWAVMGVRHRHGPSMKEIVAQVRGAVALELSARESGLVLDDEETRSRFGLGSSSLREIRSKVDAAELYYFQLELGLARDNLERALLELSYVAGVPDAWERGRVAKMLLGMVHLAEGGVDGRSRAFQQFEEVARIRPELLPSELIHPPDVLALYREARTRVESLPRGRLRVVCGGGCPTGQVWVDSLPMGVPGEAIDLPAGRYGVLLTDRFEKPRAISWLRQVEVVGGEEKVVHVDLSLESAIRGGEGPSFLVDGGGAIEPGALRTLAERVDADRLMVVEAVAGGFEAGVVDRSGRIERFSVTVQEKESQQDALGRLVRKAFSGPEPLPAVVHVAAAATDGGEVWLEGRGHEALPGSGGQWMGWGKWSAAGFAIVSAGVGTVLKIDADKREAEHRRQWELWGGMYPSEPVARQGRREWRGIQRSADWGTGLLITAGVAAVAGATLFWLDGGRETAGQPSIEW